MSDPVPGVDKTIYVCQKCGSEFMRPQLAHSCPTPPAESLSGEHVAWLRFIQPGGILKLCDSDDRGAFRVYRERTVRDLMRQQDADKVEIERLRDCVAANYSKERVEELERQLAEAQQRGQDELIHRHRCGCEVCAHSATLCPATASVIAMERTERESLRDLVGELAKRPCDRVAVGMCECEVVIKPENYCPPCKAKRLTGGGGCSF